MIILLVVEDAVCLKFAMKDLEKVASSINKNNSEGISITPETLIDICIGEKDGDEDQQLEVWFDLFYKEEGYHVGEWGVYLRDLTDELGDIINVKWEVSPEIIGRTIVER
ncbi:MAG: hypothetical protein ACXQS2_00655 [Methermicoccaceae archaeon]